MAGEYKVKVDNPARPKGDPIEVYPFGLTDNGDSFTAILTKSEVERLGNNPYLTVTATKRKKSDLNEDDTLAWEQAQAIEDEEEAARAALEAVREDTPVAGEESIAATEPPKEEVS